MERRISHPFSFTQDYRASSELPPPIYTETFSIGKIDIEKEKKLVIRNALVQSYFFRSTQALSNPVTLAIVLADNLEEVLNDGFTKLVDYGSGIFAPENNIPANSPFPELSVADKISRMPTIVCYEDILEYEDYIDEENFSNPQYDFASASKLLIGNTLVDTFLLNGTPYPVPGDIPIKNPNGKSFLYFFPYTAKCQRTRVAMSGRINFSIVSLSDEDEEE
ncbi:hypothetical protein [Leptospira terpstrae]|uniref:Uncharacterized protein n=1 Tax=Leptospira terpstrae serovar Hualin str. LT 11-33 = ATCC 700639 TaxID=1257025 RepID=N1VQY8_9LEPT|nr:hypothetical protein [Leptospira terpstrae]EMY62149.1 hypothetical protein LEP1GSC203_3871 [Leptospira terpstrae serovar Hualin str. LT 11-33 = ATCC 700639]